MQDGKAVGSALIGQPFSDPKYFWARPSATSPYPYNASSSSGSNQGPLNPALDRRGRRRASRRCATPIPDNTAPVPVDLVTASGSGLDPHISPAAAEYQVARVAQGARPRRREGARAWSRSTPRAASSGFLGEPRVNVLGLNLALDAAAAK